MPDITHWHGGQLLAWAVAATALAAPPSAPNLTQVRSKVFDIDYRVCPEAMPLDAVRLWFTRDKGSTWQLYGLDQDRQSPIRFDAPQEGLYGFYCVAANAAGSSGPEPKAGTSPQSWAYVDYTPPVVQLHRPGIQHNAAEQNVVSLRWSAIDGHLASRPISLAFKIAPDGKWHTIGTRLANTGRYDWHLPDDLQGRVVVRVTVVDQGGNRVQAASAFELAPTPAEDDSADQTSQDDADTVAQLTAGEGVLDEETRARSRQLYQSAVWHQQRGQARLAMARLRDALRLDPSLSPALVDLGTLLYGEGEYDASMQAFQLAVKQAPGLRSGLQGVARVSIAQRKFGLAAEHLRRILRNDPTDAEAWLNLGDVAVYRGDELAAREHYNKATTIDPKATEVITQARMRLDDLPWLRERYQQTAESP